MCKVSVIIPIYKVEKFIARCVESLLSQTLSDVEFIFVNDATPDSSISVLQEVIERYPSRSDKISIISHDINRGLAGARNTGLKQAKGDFIFHCDSDDWVEPTLLERLYDMAIIADADISYCDFYLSFEQNEKYMHNPSFTCASDMLRKGFLAGAAKYNVWNKLVKRNVYTENNISFPEGHNMGEDMTMIQIAACSSKVVHVPEALYHYVKSNCSAYTSSMSEKSLNDIRYNVDRTCSFLETKFGESIAEEVALFKLNIKRPFLMSAEREDYERWKLWYPESDKYIRRNSMSPLRIKVLELAASKGQFWVVKIYYWLAYKLIYGVVFR